jgi:hypothetical protein
MTKSSHSELTSGKPKMKDKTQSEINTSITSRNLLMQSKNKTDQITKLDHQECIVAHTWVRLRVTIKMMVIRTCGVDRDTSIVDVVVSAVVAVA